MTTDGNAWTGWLCCGGNAWERICQAASLSACLRLLVAEQRRRRCTESLHGCLTGGGPPQYPPRSGECGRRRRRG